MKAKVLILTFLLSLPLFSKEIDPKYLYVTGYSPPPSRPHRVAGGESFPPLPLPVVPMRRTEKKRPPTPPTLLVKVKYGIGVQWVGYGENASYLVNLANRKLRIHYRAEKRRLSQIEMEPSRYPVLYMTGLVSFQLEDEYIEKLRNYLLEGGTLILECNSGHYEIKESFLKLIEKLFPSLPLRPLPPDHPLFHCYYRIERVKYQLARHDPRIYNPSWRGEYPLPTYKEGPPLVYGVDIGSRTAIFLFTYDVGCGWAGKTFPYGNRYSVEDARKLGVNLISYILQFYPVGRFLSWEKTFSLPQPSTVEYSLAQVIHKGYWDSSLTPLSRLLLYLRKKTTSLPQLDPVLVTVKEERLFYYPLLYLTGHDRITFSQEERRNLREYVERGGVIFVDNRCGRSTFDRSFKEEIKKIFPEGKLEKIPPSHPLYHCFFSINKVKYSPWVKEFPSGEGKPHLEVLKVKGREVLIYSPYDLGWGWAEEVYAPFTRGVIGEDSFRLGINTLVYLLTH